MKISRSGGRVGGNGLAIAGICTSGLMVLMLPIWAAMLLPALSVAREKARRANCSSNMRQLAMSWAICTEAKAGQAPDPTHWCDAVTNVTSSLKIFQCPSDDGRACSYALNRGAIGASSATDPGLVLFVEGGSGWNAAVSGPEGVIRWPHRNCCDVVFLDGHFEFVTQNDEFACHGGDAGRPPGGGGG